MKKGIIFILLMGGFFYGTAQSTGKYQIKFLEVNKKNSDYGVAILDNNKLIFTPRISLSYKPDWQKDMLFRFASGFYYQPPFYKEMKNAEGEINKDIKSQKSIHFVLGNDYNFNAWSRPFKLTTELYYKVLNDIIPYKVDNVHLEYSAENIASGYAMGIDFKVNGEFVRGIESWASYLLCKPKKISMAIFIIAVMEN